MGRGAEREAQRIDNVAHALLMLCFVSPCSELIKVLSPPGKGFAEKSQPQELPFPAWQNGSGTGHAKGQHGAGVRPFA